MDNVFLKSAKFYKRQLDHLAEYTRQSSFYLHKTTGRSLSECEEFVKRKANEHFKDPTVVYYSRESNGDKHKVTNTLLGYIRQTIADGEILAPTFTTYQSQQTFLSPFSDFMIRNKKRRSVSKKKGFDAKQKGDTIGYIFNDKEQNNYKTFNNAGSGCFASKGSIMFNPSCHSTLTSTVRTESSISNASNEKLIEGNRHYRNVDVILNNLISICSNYDKDLLKQVVNKYNLNTPSAEDVLKCINRSFELYAYDTDGMKRQVEPFVRCLNAFDRCAFMFIGDLYHFKEINPSFCRNFLDKLSVVYESKETVENPIGRIKKEFSEGVHHHVNQLFADKIAGVPNDEFDKILDVKTQQDMYSSAKAITACLEEHKDLIEVLFLTEHLPASTAYIYDMIRRSVVGSDTDATMFAVDGFVNWRFGNTDFTPESLSFASTIKLFATQAMAHQLAIFSANLGVAENKLFEIAMKPEFSFGVFSQTAVAKHYYTFATVQEGVHFAPGKIKYEIKGVHLKNSAHPLVITKESEAIMKSLLLQVYRNEKIVVGEEIAKVITLEKEIKRSLLAGELIYYKSCDIKIASSYKSNPEVSPFRFHNLWISVFQEKYGTIEDPDYRAIKIPLTLVNSIKLKAWLDNMKDRGIAARMTAWLSQTKRKEFKTIFLSASHVQSNGIPAELLDVLDYKRVILDLTVSRRMILGSLGSYPKKQMTLNETYFGFI